MTKSSQLDEGFNSMKYDDFTAKFFESIKDPVDLTDAVLCWKDLAQSKPLDIQFVLVKTAIYTHYLYEKVRIQVKIHEMLNV